MKLPDELSVTGDHPDRKTVDEDKDPSADELAGKPEMAFQQPMPEGAFDHVASAWATRCR